MKFSVPYNGDPKIIDSVLSEYHSYVASFYGSLGQDAFGGGRALNADQCSSLEDLKSIIYKLDKYGIEFNYVINNTDMLNREFVPDYQNTYINFLDQLRSCGVKVLTLSNIFFIEKTRRLYNDFKISASVNLKTRTREEVDFLVKLGCKEITLHYDILKDRKALVEIRKSFHDIDFKLIVNDVYIMNCPWQKGHTRMQGAHSRDKGFTTPYFSYYRNKCVNLRHYDPDEIFKAMWISPDQLWRYEELGYNHFKLLDRLASTSWNLRVLQAYLNRQPVPDMEIILGTCGAAHATAAPLPLSHDDSPYPTQKLEVIPSINSANRNYDKAFRYFLDEKHPQDCGSCRVCSHVANSSLEFPENYRKMAIANNREWQNRITKIDFIKGLDNYNKRIKYE